MSRRTASTARTPDPASGLVRDRLDPDHVFANAYLEQVLPPLEHDVQATTG